MWSFIFEGFTSIPTALTAMTGIEGFKYIKPVTLKEVWSILYSPETSLKWAALHLSPMYSFLYIRLSEPYGCLGLIYLSSLAGLAEQGSNCPSKCGFWGICACEFWGILNDWFLKSVFSVDLRNLTKIHFWGIGSMLGNYNNSSNIPLLRQIPQKIIPQKQQV